MKSKSNPSNKSKPRAFGLRHWDGYSIYPRLCSNDDDRLERGVEGPGPFTRTIPSSVLSRGLTKRGGLGTLEVKQVLMNDEQ